MTTELQEAPTTGTIEIVEDEEFGAPDDMTAHLYDFLATKSLCGIPAKQDPHNCYHERFHETPGQRTKAGEKNCPRCGAKLCETCEVLSDKRLKS